jgi:hypothetical protein
MLLKISSFFIMIRAVMKRQVLLSLTLLLLAPVIGVSSVSSSGALAVEQAPQSTSTLMSPITADSTLVDGDYYLVGFPFDTNDTSEGAVRYIDVFFSSSPISGSPSFLTIPAAPSHNGFYSYYLRNDLATAIFRLSTTDSGATYHFYSLSTFLGLNDDATSTDTAKPILYDTDGGAFPITMGSGSGTLLTYFGNATTAWTVSAKSSAMTSPTLVYGSDATTYDVRQEGFNLYHLNSSFIADNTAYGLAEKINASQITTKEAALAAYQALPALQRYVFSNATSSTATGLNGTMANALVSALATYKTLCNDTSLTDQTYFQAPTPAIQVNYDLDRFVGFDPGEKYTLTVDGTAYGPLTPTVYFDGSYGMRLDGSTISGTSYPYLAYGKTVSWETVSDYGTSFKSPSQSLAVLAKNPANLASFVSSVALKKMTTGENSSVDALFNNEIVLVDNPQLEYMLIDKGSATSTFFLSNLDTIASWNQTGDFKSLSVYEESTNANIILASEAYMIYFRLKATASYAASDYYPTPLEVTTPSYDAGRSTRASILSYDLFKNELLSAATGGLKVTNHIQQVYDYIVSNPSSSYADGAGYATMKQYYEAAYLLDSEITKLMDNHTASDSYATDELYNSTFSSLDEVNIISFIDYAGDTSTWDTEVTTFITQASYLRYMESQEKVLVGYFNTEILANSKGISEAGQDQLWAELKKQMALMRSLPTDDHGAVDAALATAKDALAVLLTSLRKEAGL